MGCEEDENENDRRGAVQCEEKTNQKQEINNVTPRW